MCSSSCEKVDSMKVTLGGICWEIFKRYLENRNGKTGSMLHMGGEEEKGAKRESLGFWLESPCEHMVSSLG